MRHITKRFPGTVANDDVDFDLREGEVHALLGENGAGKSTLMNILYGLYHPDEGEIVIGGKPVQLGSPSAAIDAGVGMVHQHFMLIPVMTVAENIVLAAEPTHAGAFLDIGEANDRVREISERFGLAVDPKARIEDITVGQQQRVEILKALYRNADILVLDEPTAVLTPQESGELFEIIRGLTAQGKSIIFISHKLNEVTEVADRITVLRRGKKIETLPAAGATEQSLARLMVGREVLLRVDKGPPTRPSRCSRSRISTCSTTAASRRCAASRCEVRAGEIVGIAGIDGNGQTELIDAHDGPPQGRVGPGDGRRRGRHRRQRLQPLRLGSRAHPGGRQRRGLVLEFSIAENIALHDFRHAPDSRAGWLFPRRLIERAARLIKEYDVRGGGGSDRAGGLSGGNQQKVVLAREIDRDPKVLIAAQPTRGLDVGAIEFVHRRLVEERDEGSRHPARLARARGDPLALRPDPRHLRGRDRRRVPADDRRGAARDRDDRRRPRAARQRRERARSHPAGAPLDPSGLGPEVKQSVLGRYDVAQKAGGLLAPVLTALLAFFVGGLVVLITTGSNPLTTYRAIFDGAGFNWFFPWVTGARARRTPPQPPADADPHDDADPHRARRRVRVPLRPVQHRRPGPVHRRRGPRRLDRLVVRGMNPLAAHPLRGRSRARCCGALWAGIAGLLKATVGAHEVISTIMLNWIAIWVGVFLFGLGGPLQNDTQTYVPISNDVVDGAKLPGLLGRCRAPGPARRLLRRDRRARRLLADPQPDDARLRRQGGRLQPRGGALRRHQRLAQLLPRDGDLGRLRRAGRARSTSSAGSSGSRPVTSRARRSPSSASPWRCSAATPRSASRSRRCSSAGLLTGTSTRNLDPEIFKPELASNLTLLIQGLVVLFVGADVIVLWLMAPRAAEEEAPKQALEGAA